MGNIFSLFFPLKRDQNIILLYLKLFGYLWEILTLYCSKIVQVSLKYPSERSPTEEKNLTLWGKLSPNLCQQLKMQKKILISKIFPIFVINNIGLSRWDKGEFNCLTDKRKSVMIYLLRRQRETCHLKSFSKRFFSFS